MTARSTRLVLVPGVACNRNLASATALPPKDQKVSRKIYRPPRLCMLSQPFRPSGRIGFGPHASRKRWQSLLP